MNDHQVLPYKRCRNSYVRYRTIRLLILIFLAMFLLFLLLDYILFYGIDYNSFRICFKLQIYMLCSFSQFLLFSIYCQDYL